MHSNQIYSMNIRASLALTIFLFGSLFCSHLSVREEKDDMGRIIRSTTYIEDAPDTIIITRYIGKTEKPLSREYIKKKKELTVHSWLETYTYNKGKISIIKFFIEKNGNKLQSGEITYNYKKENLNKIEYRSLLQTGDKKLFMHGMDIYNYSDDELVSRRIIEYELNPKSKASIQLSQYLINYSDNEIDSMQTKILDKKSNSIINNEETDLEIIMEMIANIEKSLYERCKGY